MTNHAIKTEVDLLVGPSYLWEDFVERSLRDRGYKLPEDAVERRRLVLRSTQTEFTVTRDEVVEYLKSHSIPKYVSTWKPADGISDGIFIYQEANAWHYEKFERGQCWYSKTFASERAAIGHWVEENLPPLRGDGESPNLQMNTSNKPDK